MMSALLLTPAVLVVLYYWHRYELWVHFLALMNLDRVRDAGRLPVDIEKGYEGRTVLGWGVWLDVSYNLIWATLEFNDWPRELLFTSRLERYKYGKTKRIVRNGWRLKLTDTTVPPVTGWRLAKTDYYCDKLLDPYDPHPSGKHVRP
jgi:hypothetical protein